VKRIILCDHEWRHLASLGRRNELFMGVYKQESAIGSTLP